MTVNWKQNAIMGLALGLAAVSLTYNFDQLKKAQAIHKQLTNDYIHIPQYTYLQTSPTEGITLIAPRNAEAKTSGPVTLYIRTNEKYHPINPLRSLDDIRMPQDSVVTIAVDRKDPLAVKYASQIAPNSPTRDMNDYIQTRANNLASAVSPIKNSIDAKLGPF